jgi:hypothetical protein
MSQADRKQVVNSSVTLLSHAPRVTRIRTGTCCCAAVWSPSAFIVTAMSSNRRQSEDSPLSSPSPPFQSPGDPSEPLLPHGHHHPTFDFSSDSEDDQIFDPAYDERRPVVSPLPPSAVFLYLLSPYLKFGAMLLPNETLAAGQIVAQLVFFGVLSVFSRHVLYLLARYLRKAHTGEPLSPNDRHLHLTFDGR